MLRFLPPSLWPYLSPSLLPSASPLSKVSHQKSKCTSPKAHPSLSPRSLLPTPPPLPKENGLATHQHCYPCCYQPQVSTFIFVLARAIGFLNLVGTSLCSHSSVIVISWSFLLFRGRSSRLSLGASVLHGDESICSSFVSVLTLLAHRTSPCA